MAGDRAEHGSGARRFVRHPLALQVDYPDLQGYRSDWTENVSEGGLFIRTRTPHQPGTPIHFAVSFPGVLAPLKLSGTVSWQRSDPDDPGIGIAVERQAVAELMASVLPLAVRPAPLLTEGPFARLASLPRVRLGLLPTPLHRAERLTALLGGPEIWFKRDDLTSFGLGGNKVRKLELLCAEAQAFGCDTLVTGAKSVQSNHVRLTLAAASHLGLRGVAVLTRDEPADARGNLLLNELLGGEIRYADPGLDPEDAIAAEVGRLAAEGARPFRIRVGGATASGSMGYVLATLELGAQLRAIGLRPDHLVLATGSCGTQAGLLVGKHWQGASYAVRGISISRPVAACRERIMELASQASYLLGVPPPPARDVSIVGDYVGQGYGVPSPEGLEAIRLVARSEGVFLDPVYTGKAMAGLIDMIRRGVIDRSETVVFLHTGGWPALFA